MLKRFFDILFALVGLLLLGVPMLIISIFIVSESKGGIFFRQVRIGKNKKSFKIFKFRTMRVGADKKGLLTVGGRDPRVTKTGFVLRKYKLDELPQLLNILLGDMSFVGPRPEVNKYVQLYNEDQNQVFQVRPGLTDYASLEYIDENELLGKSKDPERTYIEEIMPEKLKLNLKYIEEKSLLTDVIIILKTIKKIVK